MKLQDRLKGEYRLLALAVVFFLAGAVFFWYDASLPPHGDLRDPRPPPSSPFRRYRQGSNQQPIYCAAYPAP